MKAIIVLYALLLTGCEASSPVISAGKGTYLVSSHVAACTECSAAVQGLKTANAFCAKQGKAVMLRHSAGTTNVFGYNVSNELYFSCVDPKSAAYKAPDIRQDDGTLQIETKPSG